MYFLLFFDSSNHISILCQTKADSPEACAPVTCKIQGLASSVSTPSPHFTYAMFNKSPQHAASASTLHWELGLRRVNAKIPFACCT